MTASHFWATPTSSQPTTTTSSLVNSCLNQNLLQFHVYTHTQYGPWTRPEDKYLDLICFASERITKTSEKIFMRRANNSFWKPKKVWEMKLSVGSANSPANRYTSSSHNSDSHFNRFSTAPGCSLYNTNHQKSFIWIKLGEKKKLNRKWYRYIITHLLSCDNDDDYFDDNDDDYYVDGGYVEERAKTHSFTQPDDLWARGLNNVDDVDDDDHHLMFESCPRYSSRISTREYE